MIGSKRSAAREIDELRGRLEALREIADLGEGRLDGPMLRRIRTTTETATDRLGHGTSHTVVALAGATGSGKSSLFNAITGTEWATTGLRRPTTSSPLAAVYGSDATALLDWLEVPNRQRHDDPELEGLVLLDLPDHDSLESAHRAEVDRLVKVVDVFGWVVDPQKYADAALHEGYLRAFGGHAAVTMVLLNQIDRLDGEARAGTVAHLGRLLAEDGLEQVRVIPISATTGEGVAALRRELAARVAERRAVVARIDADVDWLATDLGASLAGLTDRAVSKQARRDLIEAATQAAGGAEIETAVAGSYRHRGSLAIGWPPLRWMRRARPDPLSRLGLGSRVPARTAGAQGATQTLRRTAVAASPVALARLDESLRSLARDASRDLPETARLHVESTVAATRDALPDALDEAAAQTDLHAQAPVWWRLGGAVQWLAIVALVVGLGWLAALMVLDWFLLPRPPMPVWRGLPLPTWLAVGGALIGVVMAVLGRRVVAMGARRRARRARSDLTKQVTRVIEADVLAPVNAELAQLAELRRAVQRL